MAGVGNVASQPMHDRFWLTLCDYSDGISINENGPVVKPKQMRTYELDMPLEPRIALELLSTIAACLMMLLRREGFVQSKVFVTLKVLIALAAVVMFCGALLMSYHLLNGIKAGCAVRICASHRLDWR